MSTYAADYANKFWNTHRNNVYAGQHVWDAYYHR